MSFNFGTNQRKAEVKSALQEWEDRWVPIARLYRQFKAGK